MKRLIIIFLMAAVPACTQESAQDDSATDVIRMAVLPDESPDVLFSRYVPLRDYLESAASVEIELTIPSDYQDLVDRFDDGSVEFGWFGGLTFVQVEQRDLALPLVSRDIDLRFASCYLVDAADTRRMMEEFADEHFAFGPELSTSGHLMPRYFMVESGLNPEHHFESIRHSGGHDQTATWVDDGVVALGVANCAILQSMYSDGRLSDSSVRILETTPQFIDYVWAVSPSLDVRLRLSLLEAFLALDATNPEHRDILKSLQANAFLPVGSDEFEQIRRAARQAGLLPKSGEN